MYSQKYINDFYKKYPKYISYKKIMDNILEIETTLDKSIVDWNEEDLITFLKNITALSPQTVNRYLNILQHFVEYITNSKQKKFVLRKSIKEGLFDTDKLLEVTITPNDYDIIKEQLVLIVDNKQYNVRDRLIFELAWSNLNTDEIVHLKYSDIKFVFDDDGKEIALLFLNSGRIQRIEDTNIVNDIKLCMKETYNITKTKENVIKRFVYKASDYLIKPMNVGIKSEDSKDNSVLSLAVTFRRILDKYEVKCDNINILELNLEDIRRSKIIYYLSSQNEKYFDIKTVAGLLNLKTTRSLKWLGDIANKKYGNGNE